MNTALGHRGPDFAGIYSDDHISLGHCLLSIRDVAENSKQPYTRKNSPWVLVFNGQLYNIDNLHKELGLTAKSIDLDTELLFQIIEKHGWDFINYIHGMFAIGLYNKTEKVIRLYRDSSGQKNLYYYHKENDFYFSSEIKGIAQNEIDRTVDTDAVMIATSLGYIPGEKTLFNYIKKTMPSECITFDLSADTLTTTLFNTPSTNYFPTNLDDAFTKLIDEHLESKQPVSINLSGGLDSSLLAYEMHKRDFPIRSYTNRFSGGDQKYNDDADLAVRLSKDLGASHTEISISKDTYINNFIDAYTTIEEPNYNISLPNYLETAKIEGIHGHKNRVVLSGDGGDELFAGYPSYQKNTKIDFYLRIMGKRLFNYIKNKRNHTKYNFTSPTDRWLFFKRFVASYTKSIPETTMLTAYLDRIATPFLEQYVNSTDSIYLHMMLDRLLWLSNENFIRSDKLYMSQSMELRSPLSYHPWRTYIDARLTKKDYRELNGFNKMFLRKQYTNKLPDYIVKRKAKTGWRAPIDNWYDESVKKLFLDILTDKSLTGSIVNWQKVASVVEQSDKWPGKYIHLYLSLALIAKEFKLDI